MMAMAPTTSMHLHRPHLDHDHHASRLRQASCLPFTALAQDILLQRHVMNGWARMGPDEGNGFKMYCTISHIVSYPRVTEMYKGSK